MTLDRALLASVFANNPAYTQENLASFSSRGPASDGRFKPELVVWLVARNAV